MEKLLGKLQRKGNKAFYSSALILLWISTIIEFAIQWAKLKTDSVAHTASLLVVIKRSSASGVVATVTPILIILIADGILVSNA